MSATKLAVAQMLAAATFVYLLVANTIGLPIPIGLAPLAAVGVIGASIAAFVLSLKQRSFLVAGLLTAGGIVAVIGGVIATEYFAVLIFPGPILRVLIGLVVLALGIAKFVRTRTILADVVKQ